jgi:hypothetical protein
MAVSTYAELVAAVADELERTDLTSKIPDFVLFFEAMCNYGDQAKDFNALRVHAMETTTTGTPDSSGEFTLNSSALGIKRMTYLGDTRDRLTFVPADAIDEMYGTLAAGDPSVYTVEGTTVKIRPVSQTSVQYTYWTKIPALVTNSTNWLLTAYPQAYLYGSLHFAHVYLKDAEAAVGALMMVKGHLAGLNASNMFNQAGNYERRASTQAW